jgi:hypothetical protein
VPFVLPQESSQGGRSVTPRRPDRLGTPERPPDGAFNPETTWDIGDLLILVAFLIVLLACALVTWAAVEGLIL